MRNSKFKQTGSSMIEVLVALVISAVGILGLSALQISSAQKTQATRYQQQANSYMADLSARIAVNKSAAEAGAFDNALDSVPVSNVNCATSSCTAEQFADYELANWFTSVRTVMPSPHIAISHLAVDGGTRITMQLSWDPTLQGGDAGCSSDDSSGYQCINLSMWLG